MDRVLVIKCGGHAAVGADEICRDVAHLARAGRRIVLVHGGSHQIEQLATRLGVPQRTQIAEDGVPARHTDAATLEVVVLALAGVVKPALIGALSREGAQAIGLTGLDGNLLRARRKAPQRATVDGRRMVVRDSRAGTVYRVNTALLNLLLAGGVIPVVSPPAITDDGEPVNVNADRVAAAVAAAVGGELIFLTGAAGVHPDLADGSVVLDSYAVPRAGPPPGIGGGMALKLVAAREALRAGVAHVRIGDGRRPNPVRATLGGAGTAVVLAADAAAPAPPAARTGMAVVS